MYSIRIDGRKLNKMLDNLVEYTDGFIKETKAKEPYIASKLGQSSMNAFYEYLDALARTNPGMLHHVYEWGQVGNPSERLYELKKNLVKDKVSITADFLQSSSIADGSNEPFYEKATIMEEGIPVTIQEVNAKALFFVIDGEEFFRLGPIVIPSPGGEAVRGSFLTAFEEFYNVYFDKMYLSSIRFYDHFRNPMEYEKNFVQGVKGGGRSLGRATSLSWILKAPGDDYE